MLVAAAGGCVGTVARAHRAVEVRLLLGLVLGLVLVLGLRLRLRLRLVSVAVAAGDGRRAISIRRVA